MWTAGFGFGCTAIELSYKTMLVIKPYDRLTSHPDRPILPARLIIRTQCFLPASGTSHKNSVKLSVM